jgi:hypothetical protein
VTPSGERHRMRGSDRNASPARAHQQDRHVTEVCPGLSTSEGVHGKARSPPSKWTGKAGQVGKVGKVGRPEREEGPLGSAAVLD